MNQKLLRLIIGVLLIVSGGTFYSMVGLSGPCNILPVAYCLPDYRLVLGILGTVIIVSGGWLIGDTLRRKTIKPQ